MTQIFRVILSLSISGGLVGLLILLLRPVTKRYFAKKWSYYLWILVLIRLMVPVHVNTNLMEYLSGRFTAVTAQQQKVSGNAALSSEITGNEAGELHQSEITENEAGKLHQSEIGENEAGGLRQSEIDENGTDGLHLEEAKKNGQTETQIDGTEESGRIEAASDAYRTSYIFNIASFIWILGVLLWAAWRVYGYRLFVRGIRTGSVPVVSEGVLKKSAEIQARLKITRNVPLYENEAVNSPMLLGLMRPYIILPSKLLTEMEGMENDICLILHHELVHYKRRDIWYKWLFQAIVCIHWFNPLVYLFNRKFNIDCELACDEMVLTLLSEEGRKAYGNILLDVADKRDLKKSLRIHRNIPAMTLLEEKRTLKERLRNIAQYHKKGVVIGIYSAVVLAVLIIAAVICGVSGVGSHTKKIVVLHNSSETDEVKSSGFIERMSDRVLETITDASFNDIMSVPMRIEKNGNAYRMYDDDALIAGNCESDVWNAHNYRGGGNSVECQKFLFNGSDIIWIIYADKDTTLEITSSFDLKKGRFKMVQVTPDQTVWILNENGEKISEEVTLPRGRNCFKIVGQEARLEDFNIAYDKEEEKALSGIFRSEEEEYAHRVQKGQEAVDLTRLGQICIYLEDQEVSELCRSAWEAGVVFSDENWEDVFAFSDRELTGSYLVEALRAGRVKEFDSRILCMIAPGMDGEDVSECFRYLLEQGKIAQSDWEEIFIYSDADLSAEYLVEALQNGKGSGFNDKVLDQICYQVSVGFLTDIVKALDKEELTYNGLIDNVLPFVQKQDEAVSCIRHYIDLGNILSDDQLRDIQAYVSEDDFYRIIEYNGKNR